MTSGRFHRRSALHALAITLLVAPVLAACGDSAAGFRPMYGSVGIGGNAEAKMARVEFSTIPSRVGQRIRNELIFQSTGGGNPSPPEYRFDVTIRESVISTLVTRTGEAQAQVYNLEAKFQLVRIADKKVLMQGNSYGRAGFERFGAIFSNVRAREDAENRAAATIAQDIKSRLGAYLAGAT